MAARSDPQLAGIFLKRGIGFHEAHSGLESEIGPRYHSGTSKLRERNGIKRDRDESLGIFNVAGYGAMGLHCITNCESQIVRQNLWQFTE